MAPHHLDPDRTVHATHADGHEIVRYDREGHWFLEERNQELEIERRTRIPVQRAAIVSRQNGWTHHAGLSGGSTFDRIRANLDEATGGQS